MTQKKKNSDWYKLDNAAKIYPSSRSRNWTALFRLSATLTEKIDPPLLEQALAFTLIRFPTFALKLRRGLFWYYLEHMEGSPGIEPDAANPLVSMNLKANHGFMFRVRYHDCRIAVEIFHVLTDGSGGMCFLKTLIAEYLRIKHAVNIPRGHDILDCSAPAKREEMEDSFSKYSRSATLPRKESSAYHLKGTSEKQHDLRIITGTLPVDVIKLRAKHYGVSITEYLIAVLIQSICDEQRKELRAGLRKKDVKVCVPVNLRRYYPSATVRNFSSFVNPGIPSAYGPFEFQEIATRIHHLMGIDTSEKIINARMSKNVHDERNILVRFAPLFIKNPTLKFAHWFNGDRLSSSTLSNLGTVEIPREMAQHVSRFDFQLGSLRYNPVTCACVSLHNNLAISFSSSIQETAVERSFFTFLVREGIPVLIESNRRY